MKLVAIDQSLNESGLWVDDELNRVITMDKKLTQFQKILSIRDYLSFIKEYTNFDTLVMEGYSYGASNTQFTFTAGEVGGMIKIWCHDNKIKLYVIPPTLLKKYICGKGNVKKEQMLLQLYKKTGKEFDNNNIADAYGLHLFITNYLLWKEGKEYTKNEVECFKKFDTLNREGQGV